MTDITMRFIEFDDLAVFRERRIVVAGTESFIPPTRTAEQDLAWWSDHIESGTAGMWTLLLGDRIVGSVCLFGFDAYGEGTVEIGVEILSPSDYGNGYATQGLRWLLEVCEEDPDRKCVVARIVDANAGSVALFEGLGFTHDHDEVHAEDANINFRVYVLPVGSPR